MNARFGASLLLICTLLICAMPCARGQDARVLLDSAPQQSAYPNAGYVTLIDDVKQVIKPDGHWVRTTHVAAKIMNERGRRVANVHINYNSAFETIKIIRARTIRPDGGVVNVPGAEMRDVSPFSGFSMYSSAKTKVMIMPAVEDGCIIDYEYEISGRFSVMPGQFWTIRYFQFQEPTLVSRYTLEIPTANTFKSASVNGDIVPSKTLSKDGKTVTYVWQGKDYPAVEPEPYMPSLVDICPWIELSSVASWDSVAMWYWRLVEPQMKASPEINKAVRDLTKDKKNPTDKAKAIYYWVEDRIRYVALEFGTGAYEPHSAKSVFNNRYGDCKDQVTLLVTMLRSAGIKAYPVLVSAKLRGATSKRLPSPGIFDHAIAVAEIDGQKLWMDPTVEVCPFGQLPESDKGREVFIIRDGKGEFVRTPDYTVDDNNTYQSAEIKLGADGGISASVVWTSAGASDLTARSSYKYAKPSQVKEGFEGTIAAISPDAALVNYSIGDPSRRDEPLKLSYEFQAGGWADRTRKFLIFRPSLYQSALSETPFSKSRRKHDVVFNAKSSDISETSIVFPAGFTVEEVPENVSLKTDFATFDRTYALTDGVLKITEKLIRQDARIPVARYAEVKKFYEDAIRAQKSQVVLRVAE